MSDMDRDTYLGIIAKARRAIMKAQYVCDVTLILPVKIDEVAMVFATEADLDSFMFCADRDWRLRHFDSSADRMVMEPERYFPHEEPKPYGFNPHEFSARFEFMRLDTPAPVPDVTWRVEAMAVTEGHSPLHDAALDGAQGPVAFHVSYRAGTTEVEYERALLSLAPLGQYHAGYRSGYGLFSYWMVPELGNLYLKPRVNLRDVASSAV